MRVMKFGGTSLGSVEGASSALALIAEAVALEPVVVVVSALSGVTDTLERATRQTRGRTAADGPVPCAGIGPRRESGAQRTASFPLDAAGPEAVQQVGGFRSRVAPPWIRWLENRHLDLWRSLQPETMEGNAARRAERLETEIAELLAALEDLSRESASQGGWLPDRRDEALSTGERLAATLFGHALAARGVEVGVQDPRDLILTDSSFGAARVMFTETGRRIRKALRDLAPGQAALVPGFTGGDAERRWTTLGRGSSDLTAALLGAALRARVVEIWTDVDGMHQGNPSTHPDARLLRHLTYREARAMARRGAKVLHPCTLGPLEPTEIPLRVRNTFRPLATGTLVASAKARTVRRAGLILAGATGGVGRSLLAQIQDTAHRWVREGVELRIMGLLSSRGHLWCAEGLDPLDLPDPRRFVERILDPTDGWPGVSGPSQGLGPGPCSEISPATSPGVEWGGPLSWSELADRILAARHRNPLFVDCTADASVAPLYHALLAKGVGVITPNKLPLSMDGIAYRRLQEAARLGGAPFRYETTVGAALPLLGPLRELRESGDRVRRIRGVLSGTLSFLFHRMAEGTPFSAAVAEAARLGLSEPHPAEDLSGKDVARKLLILCREAGFCLEPEDVQAESLIPPALADEHDPERFLQRLAEADAEWAERVEGGRPGSLTYVACFDGERATVSVRSLPPEDPLRGLTGTANRIFIETERYRDAPLLVSGPGAGREVTASGLLADLATVLRSAPIIPAGARKGRAMA